MGPRENLLHSPTTAVDVELPLSGSLDVDLRLPLADAAATASAPAGTPRSFKPSLSQVAADLSLARMRWTGHSRSGYRGGSGWNWMRDGRAAFGDRTVPRFLIDSGWTPAQYRRISGADDA